MATVATLRVVSTDPASQGPFVLINSEDFNEAVHTLYVESSEPAEQTQEPKRRGRPPKSQTEA